MVEQNFLVEPQLPGETHIAERLLERGAMCVDGREDVHVGCRGNRSQVNWTFNRITALPVSLSNLSVSFNLENVKSHHVIGATF